MRPELALARKVQAFRARTMPEGPQTEVKRWYEFHAVDTSDGGTNTDLYIFDVISWFGITAMDLVRELMMIDTDTITVRLNSPGGDVWDGIAIKNALITHRSKVNVIVDGDAASIASVIMLAGEQITMMPGSFVMIHNASTFCGGTAADMRECADLLDTINQNIAEMYAARTGKPVKQFLDAMAISPTNQGTRYNATEAVALGLADVLGDETTRSSGASVVPGQTGADGDGWWDKRKNAAAVLLNSIYTPEQAFAIASAGGYMQPDPNVVVCNCGPKGYRMVAKDDQHDTACPALGTFRPRNLPSPVGVQYNLVSQSGNPCEAICEPLIDSGPFEEDDLPDIPGDTHPNCDCELEVAYGVDNHTSSPQPAAEVEFDTELFRSTMREVFA